MGSRVIPIVHGLHAQAVEPLLEGPQELIERLLGGLRDVSDVSVGGNIVDLRWIRSLQVRGDMADLTLSFPPVGPGRRLAELSFEVLRRLLPDTDIYVRHAR